MKISRWQFALGAGLIALSALLYGIHYFIFHDAHHIFIYMLGDLAFLPIEVLLVTVLIDGVLNSREKNSRMQKLNIVIGTFFSEAGTQLLSIFSNSDPNIESIRKELGVSANWEEKDFEKLKKKLKALDLQIDIKKIDLLSLKSTLMEDRDIILRMLENPNLLEHEEFTDLLWAIFHLTEELIFRKDLLELNEADSLHLTGDIKRAYSSLAQEWLKYMKHLKSSYPYLFSLAIRRNPFED